MMGRVFIKVALTIAHVTMIVLLQLIMVLLNTVDPCGFSFTEFLYVVPFNPVSLNTGIWSFNCDCININGCDIFKIIIILTKILDLLMMIVFTRVMDLVGTLAPILPALIF